MMAVAYKTFDYLFPFYLYLFLLSSGVLVYAALNRAVIRRWKRVELSLIMLAVLVAGCVLLARWVMPSLEHSECLLTEGEDYTHTTAGTVTKIDDAGHAPLFLHDGVFVGGTYLTVDSQTYYVISHPGLRQGMALRFTYCPEENLILSWSEITTEEISAQQTPLVIPEPEPEVPTPDAQVKLGQILCIMGFICFPAMVALESMLRHRIDAWLLILDAKHAEMGPNPWGLVRIAMPMAAFSIIGVGSILLSGEYTALVILIPGVLGMLGYTLYQQQTRVKVQGSRLVVQRWGGQSSYLLTQIRDVQWKTPLRRESGFGYRPVSRCLRIRFHSGGELILDQEHHLGLGALHRRLTQNDL